MNTLLKSVYILFIILFIASCNTPKSNAGSNKFNGKIIITEIIESKESSNGEGGYFDIYFDFYPETHASKAYRCSECNDKHVKLFYDNRERFHSNWINKWDVKTGNEYPAIRHELLNENNKVSYEIFLEPY
ncbi:MAG: hypothetical protein FWH53_08875 [Leptospirales bacterium]|nr:hypothetical protein [Leptospirales bacterium]